MIKIGKTKKPNINQRHQHGHPRWQFITQIVGQDTIVLPLPSATWETQIKGRYTTCIRSPMSKGDVPVQTIQINSPKVTTAISTPASPIMKEASNNNNNNSPIIRRKHQNIIRHGYVCVKLCASVDSGVCFASFRWIRKVTLRRSSGTESRRIRLERYTY